MLPAPALSSGENEEGSAEGEGPIDDAPTAPGGGGGGVGKPKKLACSIGPELAATGLLAG